MPTYLTSCPRNCYSTCSMRVTVEDGRLTKVAGEEQNLATPEGPCIKGLSYVERAHSDQRITRPLVRVGPRTGGEGASGFEPASWDEALDRIVSALERARREHGPQSVLYYTASGTKGLLNGAGLAFWKLFGGCTTTYGDLCWPAGLEATRLTLGENKHNVPWDLVHSRLIVLWGKNAAETNIHQMAHVQEAREAGARVVVIDPRRTETAEHADRLIQPRPGTDGALALGLAHVLVRDGLVDRPFVERHVLGYDAFAEMVDDYPPGLVAGVCEVPQDQIEELAHWMGTVHPMTICPGFGMQRYTNSGQAMRAMLALVALTGQIGEPGAGWMYANLQTDVFGEGEEDRDPLAFYPPERPDGPVRMGISTARLGRELPALTDPPVTVAWVERGNPIPQNPETNRVVEAFRGLDFRVVVEEFMTDTAREADVVLPAKNLFEQTDVIGAYWHPYLQIRDKVLEPPPEVLPETEIYRALGRRLGIPEAELAAALPGPEDDDVEAWLEAKLAPFGLGLDRLREGPVLAPGTQEIAFSDRVFRTPSGKIELVSEEARSRWGSDELPRYFEPAESLHREDGEGRRIDPETGEPRYPLHLLTPNTKNRIHSQFGNLEMIRRMAPEPFVGMHPQEATARGVAEGEAVRIFNDRGSLVLPVRFDWGTKPGCVWVTNGWWLQEGGAVNVLSRGRETDMGHGAAFHDNLVEVERA